jgi:hypothetical protein
MRPPTAAVGTVPTWKDNDAKVHAPKDAARLAERLLVMVDPEK